MLDRVLGSFRRYRNFRLFLGGYAIGSLGFWLEGTALAWLVVTLTDSGFAVGLFGFLYLLPRTVLLLPAGSLLDRHDSRWTVLAMQVSQLGVSLVLAALALSGTLEVWQLYAVAPVAGAAGALKAPASHVLVFRLVGPADIGNATSLTALTFNTTRVFGPAVGGVAIAAVGAGWCFVGNAMTSLFTIATLLAMRESELLPTPHREQTHRIFLGTLEGLRWAWKSRVVRTVLLLIVVATTFGFNFGTVIPLIASNTLHAGPSTFGWLSAAFGLGGVVGAATLALASTTSLRAMVGVSGFSAASLLVLAPLESSWSVALLLAAVAGSFTVWTTLGNVNVQLAAPDHLRGRLISLVLFAASGVSMMGSLLSGWLVDVGGTRLCLVIGGAAVGAMTCWAATQLWRPDPREQTANLVPGRVRRWNGDPGGP